MERLLANLKPPPCKKAKGSEKNWRRVESTKMKNTILMRISSVLEREFWVARIIIMS